MKQQLITFDNEPHQNDLRQIASHISNRCAKLSVIEIQELIEHNFHQSVGKFECVEHRILEQVCQSMSQFQDDINQQIHSDGFLEMLSQPEFIPTLMKEEDTTRAIERVRHMFEILKSSKALGQLLLQALTHDDVQVIIGGEHDNKEMRHYSVVLSRYGINGTAAGVLGVIGPTRMSYSRSISTVRYVSFVMSDLLNDLYGGSS